MNSDKVADDVFGGETGKLSLTIAETEAAIMNKFGLHARPAMQLVELANRYASSIEISNVTLTVDAKSIMSVMRLAATKGTVLRITADGEDADEAVDSLASLIADGFGSMERKAEAELEGTV